VHDARINPHLIERPRILQICDPGLAEAPREVRGGNRGRVRNELAEDDIGRLSDLQTEIRHAVPPPELERRCPAENPLSTPNPTGACGGLGCGDANYARASRDVSQKRVIVRRPAFVPLPKTRTGQDHRLDPELRQVTDELGRPLDAAAADRREVVRDEQDPARHG
jgi:hypothetical protein